MSDQTNIIKTEYDEIKKEKETLKNREIEREKLI